MTQYRKRKLCDKNCQHLLSIIENKELKGLKVTGLHNSECNVRVNLTTICWEKKGAVVGRWPLLEVQLQLLSQTKIRVPSYSVKTLRSTTLLQFKKM